MKNTLLMLGEENGLFSRTPSRKALLKSALMDAIIIILAIVWVFAALTKLLDYDHYRLTMHLELSDAKLLHILIPGLPYTEICAAVLLVNVRHRVYGLWLSVLMMICFITYVALVFYGHVPDHPETCDGLLPNGSWGGQLVVNVGLLLLSIIGLVLHRGKSNPWKSRS